MESLQQPPAAPAPQRPPPEDDSAPFDVTLACGVLCIGVIVSHLYQQHEHRHGALPVSETAALILLAAFVNGVVVLTSHQPLSVARSAQIQDLIDCLLVPPLMLEVGFRLQSLSFVSTLPLSLVFGVVGTLLAVACSAGMLIGLAASGVLRSQLSASQCLLFAAATAATEPGSILEVISGVVARNGALQAATKRKIGTLRHLLVGEAAINGALSVALFATFRRTCRRERDHGLAELGSAFEATARDLLQTLPGSAGFGLAAGLLVSFVTLRLRMSTAKEPFPALALLLGAAFGTYNLAELCTLSGDLALFVAGATIRQYAYHNLSSAAQQATKHIVSSLAFIGDASLSLLLGLAVVDYVGKPWAWDWPLVCLGTPVLMAARALVVLPLVGWVNACSGGGSGDGGDDGSGSGGNGGMRAKSNRLPAISKLALVVSGVRGAVPFALAMSLDDVRADHVVVRHRETAARLVTSALCVVVFTNVLLPPLLACALRGMSGRRGTHGRRADEHHVDVHTATRTASLLVNDGGAPLEVPHSALDAQNHNSHDGPRPGGDAEGGPPLSPTRRERDARGGRLMRALLSLEVSVMRPAFGGRAAVGGGMEDAAHSGSDGEESE